MVQENTTYPKDLMDIVDGLVCSGAEKEEIFEQLSKDTKLKSFYKINNAQIMTAIEDSFLIFSK